MLASRPLGYFSGCGKTAHLGVGMDLLANPLAYWFLGGFAAGGLTGSMLTLRITRQNRASHGGTIVDQSRAQAGGDNVGGNKTTIGSDRKRSR